MGIWEQRSDSLDNSRSPWRLRRRPSSAVSGENSSGTVYLIICAAPTTISCLSYRLGSFGSDVIHASIQIDSVETNLANEIVLPL